MKSVNDGTDWHVINKGLDDTDVRKLVINPVNPSILYAGTFGGVFKSKDGGATWSSANQGLIESRVTTLQVTGQVCHHIGHYIFAFQKGSIL